METCFVIMGFGKKPDYGQTVRTLDLDAAYDAIIKPAVQLAGLRCVRADEVVHSGVIDKPMYENLLEADLVIADISTANPNALYELGVRHALRPYSTIVIKEVDGKFHFDLNHLATLGPRSMKGGRYGRGFLLARDHYTGENYATCLDLRASVQADPEEARYDRKTAAKARDLLVPILKKALDDPSAKERSDYKWMVATMANLLFALGRDGEPFEREYRAQNLADWELETFEAGKKIALEIARRGTGA